MYIYKEQLEILEAYSGVIDIFVNYYDIESRCAFFFLLRHAF